MANERLNNGFIYAFFRWAMKKLLYLSLVEYFKLLGQKLSGETTDTAKRHRHVSNWVDLFTLLKWVLILLLWFNHATSFFAQIVVWYLLGTNLHTFVYYFLLKNNSDGNDAERSKKRFIKLILAILFSALCFAFLFAVPFHDHYSWQQPHSLVMQSIWYSLSNSIAGNYDIVKPLTEKAYNLMMVQYVVTFIFVSVLISKAIPQK